MKFKSNSEKYPAYPLVCIDPYTNIWSFSDCLTEDYTKHWTGYRQSMTGVLTVDGIRYRFMGKLQNDGIAPFEPEALFQKSVKVLPLTTVYEFENNEIELEVKFITPLLPDDLEMMSRPVSYICYKITAKDGKEHDVSILFGISTEAAVEDHRQKITAGVRKTAKGNHAWCGRNEGVLAKSGDNIRIDWGYLDLFSRDHIPIILTQRELTDHALDRYLKIRGFNPSRDFTKEFAPIDDYASVCAIKKIILKGQYENFVCIGYDDIHSIEYFSEPIDAYYKKNGETFSSAAEKALKDKDDIIKHCEKFDSDVIAEAEKISLDYAKILSVSYRQVCAAHKLTYHNGELAYFSKECFSNGCIGTLDVTYPSMPLFLKYNPDLVEGMVNPIFRYVKEGWNYPFAPHDVGQYPLANGQVYGAEGGAVNLHMPVEESGNVLILLDALCRRRKNYDYFIKHKDVLKIWADYLVECGFDPDNQLCTDDFTGHMAHNCNLSVKAITGIACFGDMLMRSGIGGGEAYMNIAAAFAEKWEKAAAEDGHYRLAFDQEDTWSLKYNLIWDKMLRLNLFSETVFKTEVEFYKKKFNEYGVPLDCRADFTKSDWLMWTAFLTDDKEYRDKVISSMRTFLEKTPDRAPFTDWYYTTEPRLRGFRNRTVQGGLFIGLLSEKDFE